MAIRQTADLPGRLNSTDCIPSRTRAVVRCIGEEFKKSSSGNLMIVREWEVVIPEVLSINGTNKVLAGTKLLQYLPTLVYKEDGTTRDDAKSNSALASLRDENKALGLTFDVIDDENPALECKGVYADANIGSDSYETRNPATPEDLAAGRKYGSPKLDSDGKPILGYRPRLEYIIGKATPVEGQPW